MDRKTYVQIDLSAIAHNTRAMRAQLAPNVLLMAVVKANAYGHGALKVARAALDAGADALAVAIPEEGAQLRAGGIEAPVLVLGGIEPEGASHVVENDLIQTVFDLRALSALSRAARAQGKMARVHIKLDTGMSRIGVRDERELKALVRAIDELPGVCLTGAFTHFATADMADMQGTLAQIERFESLTRMLRTVHDGKLTLHACNSAGIFRYPQAHFDMVRGGITLYGSKPAVDCPGDFDIRPAMRWVSTAIMVKEIPPHTRVSYGGLYESEEVTKIMTIPVGYADGYRRALSCGVGSVLVHGQRAPIVGRVCMDQIMVDVSDLPQAKAGDEVVLLGTQGADEITAQEIATWLGTISYEVLLSPSARVPRVIIHANGE